MLWSLPSSGLSPTVCSVRYEMAIPVRPFFAGYCVSKLFFRCSDRVGGNGERFFFRRIDHVLPPPFPFSWVCGSTVGYCRLLLRSECWNLFSFILVPLRINAVRGRDMDQKTKFIVGPPRLARAPRRKGRAHARTHLVLYVSGRSSARLPFFPHEPGAECWCVCACQSFALLLFVIDGCSISGLTAFWSHVSIGFDF